MNLKVKVPINVGMTNNRTQQECQLGVEDPFDVYQKPRDLFDKFLQRKKNERLIKLCPRLTPTQCYVTNSMWN